MPKEVLAGTEIVGIGLEVEDTTEDTTVAMTEVMVEVVTEEVEVVVEVVLVMEEHLYGWISEYYTWYRVLGTVSGSPCCILIISVVCVSNYKC